MVIFCLILKKTLENQFYHDFIQLFLLQQSEINFADIKMFIDTLRNITSMSKDWMSISDTLKLAKNAASCFETNRFIPVDSETELEDLAAKLYENGTFFAGLYISINDQSF